MRSKKKLNGKEEDEQIRRRYEKLSELREQIEKQIKISALANVAAVVIIMVVVLLIPVPQSYLCVFILLVVAMMAWLPPLFSKMEMRQFTAETDR